MQRIFVVEDDEEIARNLVRLLDSEGFGVIHAPTQRQALAMLAQDTAWEKPRRTIRKFIISVYQTLP